MISDRQKKSIVGRINRMAFKEVEWLKDYLPAEQEYIILLLERQPFKFTLESNGTAKDLKTITKFRKLDNEIKIKDRWKINIKNIGL